VVIQTTLAEIAVSAISIAASLSACIAVSASLSMIRAARRLEKKQAEDRPGQRRR